MMIYLVNVVVGVIIVVVVVDSDQHLIRLQLEPHDGRVGGGLEEKESEREVYSLIHLFYGLYYNNTLTAIKLSKQKRICECLTRVPSSSILWLPVVKGEIFMSFA